MTNGHHFRQPATETKSACKHADTPHPQNLSKNLKFSRHLKFSRPGLQPDPVR
jgi:hypothetical protein